MQAKINDVLYNLPLEVSEIKLGDFLPFNREYQKYVDLQNAESPERDIIKANGQMYCSFL
jgi:hypothetical protein